MHRSLPPRPSLEEVEASIALVKDVQRTEPSRLEMVQRQPKPRGVPEELFSVLQEMQKNLIYFQGNEEKREALALLDLEQCHRLFDDLLQKASGALSQTDQGNSRPSAVPSFHTNGVRVLGNGEEVFLKKLEVKAAVFLKPFTRLVLPQALSCPTYTSVVTDAKRRDCQMLWILFFNVLHA